MTRSRRIPMLAEELEPTIWGSHLHTLERTDKKQDFSLFCVIHKTDLRQDTGLDFTVPVI